MQVQLTRGRHVRLAIDAPGQAQETPYRNRGGADRMLICSYTSNSRAICRTFIDHRGISRDAPEYRLWVSQLNFLFSAGQVEAAE